MWIHVVFRSSSKVGVEERTTALGAVMTVFLGSSWREKAAAPNPMAVFPLVDDEDDDERNSDKEHWRSTIATKKRRTSSSDGVALEVMAGSERKVNSNSWHANEL